MKFAVISLIILSFNIITLTAQKFLYDTVVVDSLYKKLDSTALLKNDSLTGVAEFEIGMYFFKKTKQSYLYVPHIRKALSLLRNKQDNYRLMMSYFILGQASSDNHSDYDTTLSYYLRALEYSVQANDPTMEGIITGNLGTLQILNDHHKEGVNNIKKAIKMFYKTGDSSNIMVYYGNLGNYFFLKRDYDSALYYYNYSNKFITTRKNLYDLGRNYGNMALVFIRKGDAGKAFRYISRYDSLSRRLNDTLSLTRCYNLTAKAYLVLNNYDSALFFAEKSLQTAKKLNSPNRIPAAYKILYLINKQKGNNKEALHYFEIYNAYDDSVNSQKRRSEIMQLLADYEYLKKKNEIKLLKANNELNKHIIEIQRARMRFVITIGVFILIIGIVFVILWYNKRKSYLEILKKTLELEAQKEITKDTAVRQNEVDERDLEIIGKWKEKVVEKKAYLDPDFSMDTASEILETNRSYLSKALNHYYDKNFKALINEYRIREACSLLKDKDNRKYTLEAIAGRSGFKNNVSFTAAFKKYTGLTPGFFRDHAPKIIDAQKQEEDY